MVSMSNFHQDARSKCIYDIRNSVTYAQNKVLVRFFGLSYCIYFAIFFLKLKDSMNKAIYVFDGLFFISLYCSFACKLDLLFINCYLSQAIFLCELKYHMVKCGEYFQAENGLTEVGKVSIIGKWMKTTETSFVLCHLEVKCREAEPLLLVSFSWTFGEIEQAENASIFLGP